MKIINCNAYTPEEQIRKVKSYINYRQSGHARKPTEKQLKTNHKTVQGWAAKHQLAWPFEGTKYIAPHKTHS